ncbi:MAG: hypothetical protein WB562_11975, partial [Candidatus Sulfotelmatobacter sp.]
MNRNKWNLAMMTLTLLLTMGLLLAGCNKNTEQSSNTTAEKEAPPAAAATPIDPATVATVS